MNIFAILACLFFYSAMYLLYYFFMYSSHILVLIFAILLMIIAVWVTPYPHERRRKNFNDTLMWGDFFYRPLITWWKLFTLPIRALLSWLD